MSLFYFLFSAQCCLDRKVFPHFIVKRCRTNFQNWTWKSKEKRGQSQFILLFHLLTLCTIGIFSPCIHLCSNKLMVYNSGSPQKILFCEFFKNTKALLLIKLSLTPYKQKCVNHQKPQRTFEFPEEMLF